jgi:hypothetical protein
MTKLRHAHDLRGALIILESSLLSGQTTDFK